MYEPFLPLLIRSRQVYYLDEALAANIVQLGTVLLKHLRKL